MKKNRIIILIVVCCFLAGCIKSPTMDLNRAAQARLELGIAYLLQGNVSIAYQNLQMALNYAPDDYRTQLGMASYEQYVGYYDAAQQRYKQLLKKYSNNGIVRNNYGVFLCSLGQYDNGLQQFNWVIASKQYQLVADSLENAGYCCVEANRSDDANAFFVKMLTHEPLKGQYLLKVANDYVEQKKVNQANLLVNLYERIIGIQAQSLWLKIRLAALNGRDSDIQYHGEQLAQYFSHSREYQQFIANEY